MNDFQREVLEQPAALRDAARAYREEGLGLLVESARLARRRPVLLTGMGSSWAAALAAQCHLARQGRLSIALEASETLYRWTGLLTGREGPLPVLISQSGESPEILALLERLDSPCLALTNAPRSTLGRRAAVTLPLHAGKEVGVTNKTFLNSIALAALLSRALAVEGGEEKLVGMSILLEAAEVVEAAAAVEGLLSRLPGESDALYRTLEPEGRAMNVEAPLDPLRLAPWDLIGRGTGLAAVHQGALMLRELTGRAVMASSGGLYRHGPVYRSGPWTRAIVIASEEEEAHLQTRLARDILDRGGRVVFVSDFPSRLESERLYHVQLPRVAWRLFPIPATLPLQLLGMADAAARGFEPGVGVPKVTPLE